MCARADAVGFCFMLFSGELQNRLTGHSGPVFSLKWNPRDDLLATSSVDNTVIVWNTATGEIRQRFDFHSGTRLWRGSVDKPNYKGTRWHRHLTLFMHFYIFFLFLFALPCRAWRRNPEQKYNSSMLGCGLEEQ